MIEDSSYCFKETHQATHMIKEALGEVIHITGDLHGGRFHSLTAVYSLFFGFKIQFFQILLGWKCRGSDVTKYYQQAMLMIVAEELDKLLMGECFFFFHLRQRGGPGFITIKQEEDSKELAFKVYSETVSKMVRCDAKCYTLQVQCQYMVQKTLSTTSRANAYGLEVLIV